MIKAIHSAQAPAEIGPYSQAVFVNNTLYMSGIIGIDSRTKELPADFISQAEHIFQYARQLLEAAGMGFSHVAKCTVYLSDIEQAALLSDIYTRYFISPYPARETIQAVALPKNALVEISMIAVKS